MPARGVGIPAATFSTCREPGPRGRMIQQRLLFAASRTPEALSPELCGLIAAAGG